MLYVLATPIGNLSDITLRALDTLREADAILCEDTRVTSVLLKKYEISKELIPFHAANEEKKIEHVIERLQSGANMVLLSDAGTPSISDPGIRLVNACRKDNIEVAAIPGPSAITTALSIAGLPTNSFVFEGFLPQKKGRQKLLKELSEEKRTIVLYESTYRIEKLMKELNEYMPERFVAVCRELTKKFEEVVRGYPEELQLHFSKNPPKGEFTVILAPKEWVQ